MFPVLAFNPHGLLCPFVESYLLVSIDRSGEGYLEKSFLPRITQRLVIALNPANRIYDCIHSEFTPTHFFAGPNDQQGRMRLYPGLECMIINFKPGGLFKIFHLPAYHFTNRSRDAEAFLGSEIQDISRQLKEADIPGKIAFVDNWLLRCLENQKQPSRNLDDAVRLIEKNKGKHHGAGTRSRHFYHQTHLRKVFSGAGRPTPQILRQVGALQ